MTVDLSRSALVKKQIRATEIALYRMADLIDRLMKDGLPYTKATPDEIGGNDNARP